MTAGTGIPAEVVQLILLAVGEGPMDYLGEDWRLLVFFLVRINNCERRNLVRIGLDRTGIQCIFFYMVLYDIHFIVNLL